MTKQEQWAEKWRLENDRNLPLTITEEGTVDFFYSLHLQELSKIREMLKTYRGSAATEAVIDAILTEDLLAITDEK